jgi:hypothetical protein
MTGATPGGVACNFLLRTRSSGVALPGLAVRVLPSACTTAEKKGTGSIRQQLGPFPQVLKG